MDVLKLSHILKVQSRGAGNVILTKQKMKLSYHAFQGFKEWIVWFT